MQHEYSGQLLDRALLRLLPDVFFHAVWMHFAEAGAPVAPEQIQVLSRAGDELLAAGNPLEACQVLFLCAFQQIRASDFGAASSNIQRILILAEQHGLLEVACWATWGAAAVCVRRGWFQHAAGHLEHLQSLLGQRQEWVLSSVIEIIKQGLLSQSQAEEAAGQTPSSDAVLAAAFEQMLHWGAPRAARETNFTGGIGGHAEYLIEPPAGHSGFNWRSLCRKIKRVVKGEVRFTWVETREAAPLLHVDERNVPTTYAPVITSVPGSAPLLPQTDQTAMPDRASDPAQLSSVNHDQRSASDQWLALERPPEPERMSVTKPDQPAVLDRLSIPDQPGSAAEPAAPPSITAHLLGTFSFAANDATVKTWPTGKGRAVFKYMLAHHEQPIPRDVLMDVFWPQAGPEAARNSLNVALHGLRQALKTVTEIPVILFEEGTYCINPEFHVWVDVDEFDRHVQAGRRLEAKEQLARAVTEYEAAIEHYQGDFLAGDPYEEWPVLPRERLRVAYLDVLDHLVQIHFSQDEYADCMALCQLVLTHDSCREDIHCLLMRCYSRLGQHHLALRQYQNCVEALGAELEVDPAPETIQLYERIRRRERI